MAAELNSSEGLLVSDGMDETGARSLLYHFNPAI